MKQLGKAPKSTLSLSRLSQRLDTRPPAPESTTARGAAVAVVVEDAESPRVLLVERDRRRGDPWSGDIACPGGFATPSDPDLVRTAAREAYEEADVDLNRHGSWVGRLTRRRALRNRLPPWFVIEPHVFVVSAAKIEPHARQEVRRVFWCELSDVAELRRVRIPRRILGVTLRFDAVPLEPVPLWGLTLGILDELVKVMRG